MHILSLIEIEADLAGQKRGAGLGPQALRQIAFEKKSLLYEKFQSISTLSYQQKIPTKSPFSAAKHIDELLPFYKKNISALQQHFQQHKQSCIVSGDHANAIAIIASLQKTYPKKNIGIIWLDAHADLHNIDTSPSGNLHGMSLGVYFNTQMSGKKNIEPKTKQAWKDLCSLGTKDALSVENLVYVGLRSVEEEEKNCIKKNNILTFPIAKVKKDSIKKTAKTIQEKLKNCDLVYVSLDVDVLDPRVSKGTGTPVKNGFSVLELTQLVQLLVSTLPVKVFELTEINPLLDTENKMAKNVFGLFERVVSTFEKKAHE